jgi:hypothetical protein
VPDVKLLLVRAGFRPIAFNPFYAKISGCVKAGLLLSQAVYWQENVKPDNWFYKTQQEWQDETCLTRTEQEGARRTLKALGLIEEKRSGMPARVFYRVNLVNLADRLTEYQPAEKPQSSMQETRTQDAEKLRSSSQETRKPYKEAESTTESTSKKKQTALFELPGWVPVEAWRDYIDMRKRIPRAPLTDRVIAMLVEELGKLKDAGEDPEKVLNKATVRSWRSFYPVNENGNGKGSGIDRHEQQINHLRATRAAAHEILRRREEADQQNTMDYGPPSADVRVDEQAGAEPGSRSDNGSGSSQRVVRRSTA